MIIAALAIDRPIFGQILEAVQGDTQIGDIYIKKREKGKRKWEELQGGPAILTQEAQWSCATANYFKQKKNVYGRKRLSRILFCCDRIPLPTRCSRRFGDKAIVFCRNIYFVGASRTIHQLCSEVPVLSSPVLILCTIYLAHSQLWRVSKICVQFLSLSSWLITTARRSLLPHRSVITIGVTRF